MDTLTDASLVERILDGDADALAVLYDRYADRIHTMCVHLLRDGDEAADVTAEVFLTAAEHLAELRDAEKLRPWLYAIARNEVFRRTRHRTRVTPVADVPAASIHLDDRDDPDTALPVDDDLDLDDGRPAALAALLQDAAAGLDERDRTVLELHLAQGLDGQDLADALGVTAGHGYQLVHRMKERLDRSMGALLLARSGREHCDGLDEVADRWDGTYSVLWRKRFARHVDRCEVCSAVRRRLPKAVLAGTALALASQSSVLAAPVSAREQFLAEAPARFGRPRGRSWGSDGFPPAPRDRRRWPWAAGLGVLVLLALGTVAVDDGEVLESTAPVRDLGGQVSDLVPHVPVPLRVTTTSAPPVASTTAVARATTTTSGQPVLRTTTTVRTTPPAPAPPPPTTTTTEPPDTTGPTVSLSGPACAPWGSSATYTASVTDAGGMGSVTLAWTGSTSGSGSMSGGGSSWSRSVGMHSPMTSITVRATATDAAGNSRTSGSVTTTSGPTCT